MTFHCYPSYQIILPLDIPDRSYGRRTEYLARFEWPLTLNFDLWPLLKQYVGIDMFTNIFICSSCTWMCLFMPSNQISFLLDIPSWRYGWKLSFLAKVQWPLTFNLEQIYPKPPEHIFISCSIPGPYIWWKSAQGFFLNSLNKIYDVILFEGGGGGGWVQN